MMQLPAQTLQWLLKHEEPDIRYKTRTLLLDEDPGSPALNHAQEDIRQSARAHTLLSEFRKGEIPLHAYKKWNGTHWVLTSLAELNYPSGDTSLLPLRDQVYKWLFSEQHQQSIRSINGRVRRCASQEANALFSSLSLGLQDERTPKLAENLLKWQWQDGGWNCDKHPEAVHSSFWETLTPLRAMSLYGQISGLAEVQEAVQRATEVFLKRHLYRRQSTGEVMQPEFLILHYPTYWRYDILIGLKTMADAGFLDEPRCEDALNLLEQKMLPDGSFAAEAKLYQTTKPENSVYSSVNWGGASKIKPNPWVTVNALFVLKKAGRLKI
jgi:hypothetical protein